MLYSNSCPFTHATQAYHEDPDTGFVTTCSEHFYSFLSFNCCDFALALEKYALETLGGHLMRVDDSAQLPKARQFMLQENTSAGGSSRMRELMARLCRADLDESSSADVDAFAVDDDAEEIDNDTHSLVRRVWLPFKLWCLDVLLIIMLGVAGLFGYAWIVVFRLWLGLPFRFVILLANLLGRSRRPGHQSELPGNSICCRRITRASKTMLTRRELTRFVS